MYLSQGEFNERMRSLKQEFLSGNPPKEKARTQLIAKGVPAVLLESWLHCYSLGLNPLDGVEGRSKQSLHGGKLARGVLYSDEVIKTARQAADDTIKVMGGWPCIVWVTDLRGEIIARAASFSPQALEQDDAAQMMGALTELQFVDEASCGTTAQSLISDRFPSRMLAGEQHFLSCFKDLITFSHEIRANGERVAAATMCSWWHLDGESILGIEPGSDGFLTSRPMEGLVSSLARSVSLKVEEVYQQHRIGMMKEVLENSIAYASEPLLITDDCGNVHSMNSSARRFLGIRRKSSSDQPFVRLDSSNEEAFSVLKSGRIVSNVKIDIELSNGQKRSYYGDMRPILSNDKNILRGNTIRLRCPTGNPKKDMAGRVHFDDLIGTNQQFTNAKMRAMVGASSFEPVLLVGEPGTGKKSFARAIHSSCHDDNSTFVMIDCPSFTKEYAEKMLYGVFESDENKGMEGVFERANQGTLLLNEVDELDLDLQKAITRIMDMGTVRRIGGYDQRNVRIKLVATTSKGNLEELLDEGRFDQGLFLRLLTTQITLPSLRDRGEDIIPLAYRFINEFCVENDVSRIHMEEDVVQALKMYSWPGNLKQLRYFVRHACYMCKKRVIDLECMPEVLVKTVSARPDDTEEVDGVQSVSAARARLVKSALQNTNGNMAQAAKMLGISRSTLYRWRNEQGA